MRRSNPLTKRTVRWLWAPALLLFGCANLPPEEEARFDPVLCASDAASANPTPSLEAPCGDVQAHRAVIEQLASSAELDETSDGAVP